MDNVRGRGAVHENMCLIIKIIFMILEGSLVLQEARVGGAGILMIH